jgi:hypothetical protein
MRKPARATLWPVVCAAIILGYVPQSHSGTVAPASLPDLTQSAARIFRGRCVTAEVGTAEIAGALISITTYVFEVSEYLKGAGSSKVTFRQVGKREGGPHDLGQLVGLPTYTPGEEYVLFLLRESRAGLTSPAGAGEAAFYVRGDELLGMRRAGPPSGAPERMSYPDLRRVVRDLVRP